MEQSIRYVRYDLGWLSRHWNPCFSVFDELRLILFLTIKSSYVLSSLRTHVLPSKWYFLLPWTMLKRDDLNEDIYQWTMLVRSNNLLEAFTSLLWFYILLKVIWTQICTWKIVRPCIFLLNIIHKTVLVLDCEGPLHSRYDMDFFGLCYCNYMITIRPFSLPFPRGQRFFFFFRCPMQPCLFDCGKISGLSVRVLRSFDWLFPWGPPVSERVAEPNHTLRPFFS